MRILHIVGTMSAEAGGPAEAVRMLVEFAPANVSSEIVTCDEPSDAAQISLPCPVHALGSKRPGFYYSAALIPWLRANRSRFDGVIVHGLWTYPSYAAWRALAGRVPYVVFAHGMLDPYFKRAFPLKHLKKWVYWLAAQYWILRSAHRVLFTTTVERDLARQSFWLSSWKPLVVPLGTEKIAPAKADSHAAFFDLCPEVRGCRFLLYLGRIDAKKGCDLLLRAFVRRAHHDPGIHLVVAGPDPGHWKPDLTAIAEHGSVAHRVHWPGMVKGIAKAGAFDLCEAFILPSHQENFGIAVVEALAAGRPVLLSDKINIAHEIAADGCGLVERDTLDGTIQLLDRWFDTPAPQRAAMSTQALHTFASRYDMRANTAAVLHVFEAPAHRTAEAR
jgi:glycosyltransferase involved in cell wall biosynthesis